MKAQVDSVARFQVWTNLTPADSFQVIFNPPLPDPSGFWISVAVLSNVLGQFDTTEAEEFAHLPSV